MAQVSTSTHSQKLNPHNADSSSPLLGKKTRTRSGCLSCRRRRRKCDEHRPECRSCRQRGDECEWGTKFTFKAGNATELDAEHPSMRVNSNKRARHFKILDVTSQIERDHQGTVSEDIFVLNRRLSNEPVITRSPHVIGDCMAPSGTLSSPFQRPQQPKELYNKDDLTWHSEPPSSDGQTLIAHSGLEKLSYRAGNDLQHSLSMSPSSYSSPSVADTLGDHSYSRANRAMPYSTAESHSSVAASFTGLRTDEQDAAAELLSIGYLPAQKPQHQMASHMSEISNESPNMQPLPAIDILRNFTDGELLDEDMFIDQDGIFLPGSTYQELHSTLRDHLIYTARSNVQTRSGTPEEHLPGMSIFEKDNCNPNGGEDMTRSVAEPGSVRSIRTPEITPQREYILWKTWIDEVAPWLDKFDNNRHFERNVTMLAKNISYLKYSILALCARQIERKDNSGSSSESLRLYQEAIHLLLPELQTKDTAVIASCVILCVLEMMSCAPKEWRRHLEGCANLLIAVGINGLAGGIEGALFWCFARMDLCGALISRDLTLIPISHWASNSEVQFDIGLVCDPSSDFDSYANCAVFLCAHCVTYLHKSKNRAIDTEGIIRTSQWTELLDILDNWYSKRPEEMKPILTTWSAETAGVSPFPTVLYPNAAAVSGNQLYHTSMLLMLQEKPSDLKYHKKQKSIFWHARQICAISESNTHHGAWTNSIQPIWIAGKIMSHPSEHRAIINVLERIQRETGWQTSWRIDDLKNWWGD